ncbi:hypothetical protein EST38_g5470 [Candolleomyces aberdarensis]|uniref:Nephrocystin 3-like N-terminal domain-containing protein n=1 Tax=Candolleomyces aberdarensis TaxID=2316362 RepID=A0A4Q2DKF7_9AGAR|nr:hypothetical protein EST38_g5470 [Candolleomyces aberdarensis]
MSENTKTRVGNSPIPSGAATPVGSGSQSSSKSRMKQAGSDLKKTVKKPFSALNRLVKPKRGEGLGEGYDNGSGGTAATSGADVGGAPADPTGLGTVTLHSGTDQELGTIGHGAELSESQGIGETFDEVLAHMGSNAPLGQDLAFDTLAPPADNTSFALGAAQKVTQDTSAAPPPTLGQLEDPVLNTNEPLVTTSIVAPTSGTLGPTGEGVGRDLTKGAAAGQAGEGVGVSGLSGTSSSKTWSIVAGALKKTLSGAVSLIPEPFKGPAEVLLKVVNVFEQAKSSKEEIEDLRARCSLLNESMVNAIKGRDEKLLSVDLKDSIGRLVKGIHDTFLATIVEYSTGFAAYVLVEDNAEALKEANRKIDQVLQCFWLENILAGGLVLSDVRQTVKDQEGWLAKFGVAVDRHFKNAALDKLKPVPGAAYDSQDLAKVNPCFEGTRVKLLVGIGRWMSDTALDGQESGKPVYVLDGIAGIGKSTVAKTVAQRAAGINSLGASFFFSRDQADRQHASSFVHTIASQLAFYDPSYGKAIAAAIDEHPESLHKLMAQQFSVLVAQPLCNLLEQRATPLVFVFDALDECTQPDASDILSLIITSVSQLPNVKK